MGGVEAARAGALAVDGSLVSHTFHLPLNQPDGASLGRLLDANTYWIWAQDVPIGAPPLRFYEWTRAGIADLTANAYAIHVVNAGTFHRIEGVFDYWLRSDADHIWVQAPRQDSRHYILVAGGRVGVNRSHEIAWFCHGCGAEIGSRQKLEHDGTPGSFLRAQEAAVSIFNAHVETRQCRGCGADHPLARPFQAQAGPPPATSGISAVAGEERDLAPGDLREGRTRLVRIEGKEVLVVRSRGEVFALGNACPHKGASLAQGEVHGTEIVCPWHRFRFDMRTGECVHNPRLRAETFDVRLEGERVVVAPAAVEVSSPQ